MIHQDNPQALIDLYGGLVTYLSEASGYGSINWTQIKGNEIFLLRIIILSEKNNTAPNQRCHASLSFEHRTCYLMAVWTHLQLDAVIKHCEILICYRAGGVSPFTPSQF